MRRFLLAALALLLVVAARPLTAGPAEKPAAAPTITVEA